MTKIEPVKAWAVIDPRNGAILEVQIKRENAAEALQSWFADGHRIIPVLITPIQENEDE